MIIDNPTVYHGSPSDISERDRRERQVYEFLDGLGIDYSRIDHRPSMTMENCEERGKLLGITISKNIFLCNTQKTRYYLLVMPASKRYVTRIFSKAVGSARLSFAPPEDMERLLGCTPGSASIMGLLNDTDGAVNLCIDSDVLGQEYFGCHPCLNTSSIRLKMTDLTKKIIPALGHVPQTVTITEE